MLLDKYRILRAPEMETGTDTPAEPAVPMNETPADGPGSGRSEIRKQLEQGFERARKETQAEEKSERDRTTGRYQKSRARQEQELQESEQEAPEADAEVDAASPDAELDQPEITAPEGWAKEAKTEWANLPPAVQAAVTKREIDMARGVEELKKKYVDIDNVIAPRLETIRRHGHTPAAAVNQLFAWFEALGANPKIAFPALAESFRFDLKSLPGLQPAQAPAPAPAATGKPAVAEEVPEYAKTLEQKIAEMQQTFQQQLGTLYGNFQQQSQARTEENLAVWSKDKPYFEDVRQFMGQLIGSGTVPPLPNGNADLDKAYDMALWAMPEVRAKIQADQQAKAAEARRAKLAEEKAAQEAAAAKARKAAGSLRPGAPGTPTALAKGKKSKSVRESIMEARAELADNA